MFRPGLTVDVGNTFLRNVGELQDYTVEDNRDSQLYLTF
jgi:hypothetical protein